MFVTGRPIYSFDQYIMYMYTAILPWAWVSKSLVQSLASGSTFILVDCCCLWRLFVNKETHRWTAFKYFESGDRDCATVWGNSQC